RRSSQHYGGPDEALARLRIGRSRTGNTKLGSRSARRARPVELQGKRHARAAGRRDRAGRLPLRLPAPQARKTTSARGATPTSTRWIAELDLGQRELAVCRRAKSAAAVEDPGANRGLWGRQLPRRR